MQELGPYRLGARLGRGSSGQTFLAARPGEPPVALHVFDEPYAEDTVLAAELERRARVLEDLRQPARAQLLHVGREPTLHYACELVGGQPLMAMLRKARLEQRPLPLAQALAALRPAVDALVEAHEHADGQGRGVVHGALAPRELLVDYQGKLRVLGVGLSAIGRLPPSANRRGYVAPEVVRGRAPSPASDTFSMAAIVYEVVAGRGPFRSPRSEGVEKAVLQGDFTPLRPSQVEEVAGLSDWVNATLVPKPELRPVGLSALAELLAHLPSPDLNEPMRSLFASEAEGFQKMCAAVTGASSSSQDLEDALEPLQDEPSATFDLPQLVERDADVREELGELRQVARYVLDARVWSEGPVEEFHGTDPNLDRPVRLRLLTPGADGPVDAEMCVRLFKREARYLARVDHPCLPRLLDAGRAADRYFTVLSRRPGLPLSEHVAAGHDIDPRRLLDELVGAMEAAHEVGLLLGRLPLDAVALTPSGRADIIRLPTLHSALKGPHPMLEGRTTWVPPEWVESGRWDGASDQWVIASLVLCALTGKGPGPSLAALEEGLLEEDEGLLEVLTQMARPDPEARFASAHALRVRLRSHEPGQPSHELGVGLASRFAELCHRAPGLSLRTPSEEAFFDDPARVAAALARRRGRTKGGAEVVMMAAALRGLARRTRLPPLGEELARLVPPAAGDLLEVLDARPSSGAEGRTPGRVDPEGQALDAEIVRLAEAFVEGYRQGRRPVDDQLRALRAHFSSVLVDDLVLEMEQRLAAQESLPSPRGRVLLAGFGIRGLAQQLGSEGLEVVVTQDGHEAWELLRGRDAFAGAILSHPLQGRDGLSLIKLCRSHPGLHRLPVWLAAEALDAQTRSMAEENGAIAVDGPERLELLPTLVRHRLTSGAPA